MIPRLLQPRKIEPRRIVPRRIGGGDGPGPGPGWATLFERDFTTLGLVDPYEDPFFTNVSTGSSRWMISDRDNSGPNRLQVGSSAEGWLASEVSGGLKPARSTIITRLVSTYSGITVRSSHSTNPIHPSIAMVVRLEFPATNDVRLRLYVQSSTPTAEYQFPVAPTIYTPVEFSAELLHEGGVWVVRVFLGLDQVIEYALTTAQVDYFSSENGWVGLSMNPSNTTVSSGGGIHYYKHEGGA